MSKPLFEEKDRINRLIFIDDRIRSGAYPNASALAEKAEVAPRTILRDIDYLRLFYNAPIAYDARHRGYYYTEPDFFVKTVLLTEGELFSIAVFDRLLEQYRHTPLEENLREIFRKIVRSLPRKITVDSCFLTGRVSFIPGCDEAVDVKVYEVMFTALRTAAAVSFEYRALQKTACTKRTVEPYHAVCRWGEWYIIGRCRDREELGMFAFSRIKNARPTGETFRMPARFDPHEYFDREMGVWASSRKPCTVEFLVDGETGIYALERQWHKSREITENEGGGFRVKFTTARLPEVARWVLGQGHTVKVLNPPELVGMVKDEAEKVRGLYGG
jgi:predicted DNA-binding transcriptional regulator YafY